MRIGIMQPYLFPYIGYFQLIKAVDEFVVYDNIEYTKKGWINRNRILSNGIDTYLSFPLKKDSDFLHVRQRCLSENWRFERKKVLNKIVESYRKAEYFKTVLPVIEEIILFEDENLFSFILNSLNVIKAFLGINTVLTSSSSIPIDHSLKGEKKVIEICKSRRATTYINPIGGLELYSRDVFQMNRIDLKFIKSGDISYNQFHNEFIPWLSIIDVMMFNSKDEIKDLLMQVSFI